MEGGQPVASDVQHELELVEAHILRLLACRRELLTRARQLDERLLRELVAGATARWQRLSTRVGHPEVISAGLLGALAHLDFEVE